MNTGVEMNRPHFRDDRRGPVARKAVTSDSESVNSDEYADFDDVDEQADAAPLPTLAELRDMMKNLPEIRTDLVDEVRRRMERGEYHTRDAAEEAARRIMDEQE